MKLGIVTTAALAAALLAGSAAAQQQVDERRPATPTGTVEIHNVAGSVRVLAWDRSEVRVSGTLGRGTERLHFGAEGGKLVVRVVLPRNGRNVRGSDLEVRVPARSTVQVRTVSAGADVSGVGGAVEVRTVSGDVSVRGAPREVDAVSQSGDVAVDAATARVHAASVSGDVTVAGNVRGEVAAEGVSGDVTIGATAGEVHVANVNGNVRVASVRGRATIATVSGELAVAGPALAGELTTVSGDVTVSGGLARDGRLAVNTHSGNVAFRLARGAGASVDFNTFSGALQNAFSGARVTRRSAREQSLVLGGGGARVSVRTFSGDVSVGER